MLVIASMRDKTGQKRTAAAVAVCGASGAMLGLAFPGAGISWLAWLALAPFFHIACSSNPGRAAACGMAFGMGFTLVLLQWAALFGMLAWVALAAAVSALSFCTYAAAVATLSRGCGDWSRACISAGLWVLFEWLSSLWIIGFPWWTAGSSQYRVTPIVQVASIGGIWAVSLLVAVTNAVIATGIRSVWHRGSRRAFWRQAAAVSIALAAAGGWGAVLLQDAGEAGSGHEAVRVGVVQGNVRQNVAHDDAYRESVWSAYKGGTREAAEIGAQIAVWPEGTVPGCAGCDPVLEESLGDIAADNGLQLIVGSRDEGSEGQVYNSAFLIGRDGIIDRYRKVRLVPFAEVVFFREHMPYLETYRILPYDISPGNSLRPLNDAAGRKIGALICFESVFPDISRELAAQGAQVLVVLTNDTWFERTAGAEQHLAKSVFRAVENRRWLVRAASTGISCFIDPCGRIVERTGLFEQDLLVRDVVLRSDRTLYNRFGDWLPIACAVVALVIGAASRLRGR